MQSFLQYKQLAKDITTVENNLPEAKAMLQNLHIANTPIIGITGAPGAGKSSIVNALCKELIAQQKKIAVVAVDPTSPFNYGSILGDRVRLSEHFLNNQVYIRSMATRGSLGGLCQKIIEVSDVLRSYNFDYIIIETVGVGQSEVEIAGLADITLVALTPEGGDEIQHLKSGVMEIADIFIVNKSDRPDADFFCTNLHHLLHQKEKSNWQIPVIKTVATEQKGIDTLLKHINLFFEQPLHNTKRSQLLTQKALQLIQQQRMNDIDVAALHQAIASQYLSNKFNLYSFVEKYF